MRLCHLAVTILLIPVLWSCGQQSESSFAKWQAVDGNQQATKRLQQFLIAEKVGDIIPLDQLLRSDTQWRRCHTEPFAIPPKNKWPDMVPTLRLLRDEVQPLIGPVEAMSVFRSPDINRCIKGASRSYHLKFRAIDMRPVKNVSRAQLIEKLCALHARKGKALNIGLGIYKATRFHIDTAGYRRWGHDHHAISSPCATIVAPQRKKR
jgi:uncharacterized protein YcbK (DUF882 family)